MISGYFRISLKKLFKTYSESNSLDRKDYEEREKNSDFVRGQIIAYKNIVITIQRISDKIRCCNTLICYFSQNTSINSTTKILKKWRVILIRFESPIVRMVACKRNWKPEKIAKILLTKRSETKRLRILNYITHIGALVQDPSIEKPAFSLQRSI